MQAPQGPVIDPATTAAAAAADAKRLEELDRMRKETMRTYEITTYTSDIKGAACDARVFCVINGSKRSSGELRLENGPNNFQRGKEDKFVHEVQVRHACGAWVKTMQ